MFIIAVERFSVNKKSADIRISPNTRRLYATIRYSFYNLRLKSMPRQPVILRHQIDMPNPLLMHKRDIVFSIFIVLTIPISNTQVPDTLTGGI